MGSFVFRDADGGVTSTAPYLMRPRPLHALTEAASLAVAAVVAHGAPEPVTGPLEPVTVPYERAPVMRMTWGGKRIEVIIGAPQPIDPVTAGARSLLALAEAVGMQAHLLTTHDSCTVEGFDAVRCVGFRAVWHRGATRGASWHAPWKTETVADNRPVGVNRIARTALADHRGEGAGNTRTIILASPWGLGLNITELTARLNALKSAA